MAREIRQPGNIREKIPQAKIIEAQNKLVDYVLGKFNFSSGDVVLVGIQTRGAALAKRIADEIKKAKGIEVPLGSLDITLYRDDFSTAGIKAITGETNLSFDVDHKEIILVDDVLFTGRTVRAAIDEIIDFGRPKSITLVVLVDRGHRELPIAADFAPIKIATRKTESVTVLLRETDEKEEIVISESGH